MRKYLNACAGNKQKTMQLYRYNLRLCQRFYGALNLFEVMLRNAINEHYAAHFADPDWIVNQADSGKLLSYNQIEIRQTEAGYRRRGIYNNDKMVASLTMGFWTKLFSKKRYKRGGKTLLRIEPYYKKYHHLPLLANGTYTSDGFGTSRGLDVFCDSRSLVRNMTATLSYSFNASRMRRSERDASNVITSASIESMAGMMSVNSL